MDNKISNVGTQYIICECGDNFPNEKLLNKHLANGHGKLETFQCDVCPEMFTSSSSLSGHMYTHQEADKKPEVKTYGRKIAPKEIKKEEKKPPVIKLKNLMRIDSISLLKNLKFIKIEPQQTPEPAQPDPKPEPEPEPKPEPEPEPDQPVLAEEEEEGQVIMKSEMHETEETEEIYYQCDVCNSIFYSEWDFNIHYQSAHALKLEPGAGSAERALERHLATDHALERHLATDHADDERLQAEADTAYYYECELGAGKTEKVGPQIVNAEGRKENTDVTSGNANTGIYPDNSEDAVQAIDERGLLKVVQVREVKKAGRPKKIKRGRPPKEDVYSNMPPGLSQSQKAEYVKKRRIEIRKEQWRKANQKYKKNHPERVAKTLENYKKSRRNRKAVAKYAKNHPEVHRIASAKYAKKNPEVNRRASRKYQEKKKLERMKMREEANTLKEFEIKQEALEVEMDIEDLNEDVETRISWANSEEDSINMQELDDHGLLKVEAVEKRGRPKKIKGGRPPKVDFDLDIPPRSSQSQVEALAGKGRIDVKKEQTTNSSEKYTNENPDCNRSSCAKYAKKHPEVNRRSSREYQDKRLQRLRVKEEPMTACDEIDIKHEDFNEEILGY